MQDIIKKTGELIEKYKKKRRLNNEEELKANEYIEVLLKNPQYRGKGYEFMPSLPAKTSADAFLSVWLDSKENDRNALVNGLLECKEFNGEAGYNRLMELCSQFIPTSKKVAFQFLVGLSEKMTSMANSKPAKKFLARFKNSLMSKNDLLKIPIGSYDITASKTASIATLVIYGLLLSEVDDSEKDVVWKRRYLDWLGQCCNQPVLPLLGDIEKKTAGWPEELQRFGQEKGLLKTVTTRLSDRKDLKLISNKAENNNTGKNIENSKDLQPTSTKNSMETGHEITTQETPFMNEKTIHAEEFNALLHLKQLGQYITKLETQIKKAESRLINSCLEVKRERQEQKILAKTNAEVMNDLQKANARVRNHEFELLQLRTQLEEIKNKHENDKTDLLDMIDKRSAQIVQQLKNRLVQSLRTDYQDFKQIENDQMTIKLGENLRLQIAGIFQILTQEDIRF